MPIFDSFLFRVRHRVGRHAGERGALSQNLFLPSAGQKVTYIFFCEKRGHEGAMSTSTGQGTKKAAKPPHWFSLRLKAHSLRLVRSEIPHPCIEDSTLSAQFNHIVFFSARRPPSRSQASSLRPSNCARWRSFAPRKNLRRCAASPSAPIGAICGSLFVQFRSISPPLPLLGSPALLLACSALTHPRPSAPSAVPASSVWFHQTKIISVSSVLSVVNLFPFRIPNSDFHIRLQPVPKNKSFRKLRANSPCIRANTYVP